MRFGKAFIHALLAGSCLAMVVGAAAKDRSAHDGLVESGADIHVYINQRRDSGHPWHGPGDIFVLGGKSVQHFPEAPGAVLCIVTYDGKVTCPGQRAAAKGKSSDSPADRGMGMRGKKLLSPCPSAYDCEFDEVELPRDEIFGLVVLDPAMAFVNLVDGVILTRRKHSRKDPEVQEFDQKLRSAIATLAPPGPFEKERRLRSFQVRMLDDCTDGCKLSQSEISIDPR